MKKLSMTYGMKSVLRPCITFGEVTIPVADAAQTFAVLLQTPPDEEGRLLCDYRAVNSPELVIRVLEPNGITAIHEQKENGKLTGMILEVLNKDALWACYLDLLGTIQNGERKAKEAVTEDGIHVSLMHATIPNVTIQTVSGAFSFTEQQILEAADLMDLPKEIPSGYLICQQARYQKDFRDLAFPEFLVKENYWEKRKVCGRTYYRVQEKERYQKFKERLIRAMARARHEW